MKNPIFPFSGTHLKRTLSLLTFLSLVLPFVSCKKSEGDYPGSLNWIYETMKSYYLFYEDLPAKSQLDFSLNAEDFLLSAVSPRDQKNGIVFSHIEKTAISSGKKSLSSMPTFGFEAAVLRDQNNNYYLRILYVYDNSPAAEAGLARGNWIIAADNRPLGADAYTTYVGQPQEACSFTLARYFENRFYPTDTVLMPAPRSVYVPSVYKKTTIPGGSRTASYIMYNEFDDNTEIFQSLFSEIASSSTDDIILDLRYNPGGYVATAQALCTHLAPSSALGKTCLKMTYNKKIGQTQTYTFDASLLGNPAPGLSYRNLYIIATENTASASEIVINCLRPYMQGRIFQIGTATFGKNVAQSGLSDADAPGIKLWLTTSYLSNAEDFSDYFSDGLQPDYYIEESFSGYLGELGSTDDLLIRAAVYHMENGTFPSGELPAKTAEESNYPPLDVTDCSLRHKAKSSLLTEPPVPVETGH